MYRFINSYKYFIIISFLFYIFEKYLMQLFIKTISYLYHLIILIFIINTLKFFIMKRVTLFFVAVILMVTATNSFSQIQYCDGTTVNENSNWYMELPITMTPQTGTDAQIQLFTEASEQLSLVNFMIYLNDANPSMWCGTSTSGDKNKVFCQTFNVVTDFYVALELDEGVEIPTDIDENVFFMGNEAGSKIYYMTDNVGSSNDMIAGMAGTSLGWQGVVRKYVPMAFNNMGAEYYYGWVCISTVVDGSGTIVEYTVHDWAYNTVANEAISMGEGRPVVNGVMSSFSVYDTEALINGEPGAGDGSISVTLPYGEYDLSAYTPTFTTTPAEATVTVGGETQESGVSTQNFSEGNVITYVVSTDAKITTTYTATVSIVAGNSECNLTMFGITEATAQASIGIGTISGTVPANIDKSALHLQWVGSNNMVVTTEAEGILEPDMGGTGAGTAVNCCNPVEITFTSEDGSTSAVYTLTVGGGQTCAPVETITLTAGTIDADAGTYDMSTALEVLPAEAAQTVTWSFDGDDLGANIDNGVVTASGEDAGNGTVTVKATATDGSDVFGVADIVITNQEGEATTDVESITLTAGTIEIDGGTLDMKNGLEVLPAEATQTVVWTIEGDALGATIDNGVVTASSEDAGNGTVTVKATATDGSDVYGEAIVTISNQASETTTEVVFTVTDPQSNPVAGVEITVDVATKETQTTDDSGVATFNLEDGNYSWSATKTNWEAQDGAFVVPGDVAVTITDFTASDGIDELNSNVNIYPNPSNGEITVKVNGTYSLQVIDITGKVISTQEITNTENINIKQTGIYMLRLTNNNETLNYKIVVE